MLIDDASFSLVATPLPLPRIKKASSGGAARKSRLSSDSMLGAAPTPSSRQGSRVPRWAPSTLEHIRRTARLEHIADRSSFKLAGYATARGMPALPRLHDLELAPAGALTARPDLSSMRHRPASRAPAAAIASISEHRVPAAAPAPSAATPSPKNLRVTDALKRANDQRIEDAVPTKNQSSMGMDAAAELLLEISERERREAERAARRGGHVPGAAPPRTPEWGSTRTSSHAPLQASSLPSSLKASAPVWWSMPKEFVTAADAFDKRHETRKVAAERLLTSLRTETTSYTKDQLFDRAIFDVRSNVFVTPEREEEKAEKEKRKRYLKAKAKGKQWKLETSIWAPRAKWADSKSFYDTDNVEGLKFGLDWKRALQCGLERFILKHDDDDPTQDIDGDGVQDEIDEVRAVVWRHHLVYFLLFDHFASLGGNESIDSLSLNEWTAFVQECDLVQKRSTHCKQADLDRLFIAVDGATARANGGMSNKRDKSLERTEFLHCLVRLAVAKYVNPGFMTDVSEAVERLCSADIAPKLGIELQDPNTFRRDLCYTEEVDNVLRRHEPSLKLLFGVLAKRPTKKENKSLGLLLSLGDWKVAVRRLELIGVDFAERDATRCFVFSRMCVIDGSSERGRLKEGSLPFEGFLEALCRVALLKALPTDEEMVENGFNPQSETYEYLEWLKYEEGDAYDDLLDSYSSSWGSAPRQLLCRALDKLLQLLFHTVEDQIDNNDYVKSKSENGTLTPKEMGNWKDRMWADRCGGAGIDRAKGTFG